MYPKVVSRSNFEPSANVLDENAFFYSVYHGSAKHRSSTPPLEMLDKSP